jgi:hypothetical protein
MELEYGEVFIEHISIYTIGFGLVEGKKLYICPNPNGSNTHPDILPPLIIMYYVHPSSPN